MEEIGFQMLLQSLGPTSDNKDCGKYVVLTSKFCHIFKSQYTDLKIFFHYISKYSKISFMPVYISQLSTYFKITCIRT